MAFTGFSTDQLVSLPPELFTAVLPQVTSISELKVTLHVFYRLTRQRGQPRRISWDDLAVDQLLQQSLRAISPLESPIALLDEGLSAAVQRSTFFHVVLPAPTESRWVNWYVAHTSANRAWVEEVQQAAQPLAPPVAQNEERPTLMSLYEQNIGLITPLLVEELRQAEERYPPEWLEDAIRQAVRSNVRSWRYVRKVLERWETHGRGVEIDNQKRPVESDSVESTSSYRSLFRLGSDTSDLD
ncbi:MAG: DnaD domain protein [Chloroflexaceae bacterium]|nr:DnaD domain protein [Chloroflexaceae bacterium]